MLKSSIDANGSYAIQNSASRMEAKDSRPSLAWPDPSRSRKGEEKRKKGLVTLNRMPFHNGM